MMNCVTITGSGGGWNTTLSLKANFYDIIKMIQENANRTQPTGFTSDNRYVPVLYVSTYRHTKQMVIVSHISVGLVECHAVQSLINMEDLEGEGQDALEVVGVVGSLVGMLEWENMTMGKAGTPLPILKL